MLMRLAPAALLATIPVAALAQTAPARDNIDALIEVHSRANKVPSAFVHRVIKRESNYNPRAKGGSALGLMQIKHATARGLGYSGEASGLLDPEINLKYGVAYLAGAYRAAKGDLDQAYRYYNRGYYYAAKRLGITTDVAEAEPAPAVPAATSASGFASLFNLRTSAAPVQTASAEASVPLAYTAAPAAPAGIVEVPLPPQRPTVLAGAVLTAAMAEPVVVAPAAGPAQVAAPSAIAAAQEAVEVPLPPRRPATALLAAIRRPAVAPIAASGDAQAVASAVAQ